MQHAALTITDDTVFAALPSQTLGRQALEILDRIGQKVELMCGLIPFIPAGSVLFLTVSELKIPSRYLRVLPAEPNPERTLDDALCRHATEMGYYRKASRIVFISTAHADPASGRFEGEHATRFTLALKALVGHREPERRERSPKRHWREVRDQKRESGGRYGRHLWDLYG